MERVVLSRRNLLTLLSKLDRVAAGESSNCMIVKRDDVHEKYPQTMKEIEVLAVEDDEYYATRNAGVVLPADDPSLK